MNKIKLNKIANILSGINYDHRKQKSVGETIAYLQIKNFNEQGKLKNDIIQISKTAVSNKLLISQNDVLFSAKGTRNYSVVYNKEAGEATASSTFFIIRINVNNVLPEYLTWYINQKTAQEYLKLQSVGSITSSINKKLLGEMDIPLPNLELQRKIVAIDLLRKKEKALINEIKLKKDLLIECVLNKIITETNE